MHFIIVISLHENDIDIPSFRFIYGGYYTLTNI